MDASTAIVEISKELQDKAESESFMFAFRPWEAISLASEIARPYGYECHESSYSESGAQVFHFRRIR